jgi:hypothetical protein
MAYGRDGKRRVSVTFDRCDAERLVAVIEDLDPEDADEERFFGMVIERLRRRIARSTHSLDSERTNL